MFALTRNLQEIFTKFWSHHPAFLYGLSAFFGSCLALYDLPIILWFFLFLFLVTPLFTSDAHFYGLRLRLGLAIALGIATFSFTKSHYKLPELGESIHAGTADFKITALNHSKTPFGPIWTYKGVLKSFISVQRYRESGKKVEIARNIPINFTIPSNHQKTPPLLPQHYHMPAKLKDAGQGRYSLVIDKKAPWIPLETTWSLAEWRHTAKMKARKHIHTFIKDLHTAAFLAGIVTGEFDDRLLAFELSRFGLQHLMAISGLHFAILSSILGFLLSLLFSRKIAAVILIGILSAYFLFLGTSPSVIRAWVAITITLLGIILGKRSIAINSLGIALLILALWDPLSASNIGFQFSFAVTAAILVWFKPCEVLCQKLFVKRRLSQIVEMGNLDQHGYCLLFFLRQGLALCLAVNLVALPLTLYHFHKFPMMSLVYNLFFPFLISISILLLIAAFLMIWVFPYGGSLLYALNENFTKYLLNFAFNLPKSFDITMRVDEFSPAILIIYLTIAFIGGIVGKKILNSQELFENI